MFFRVCLRERQNELKLVWDQYDFSVQSVLYLCLHELRQNETQNGMDIILVILLERKFQTDMRASCEQNLCETIWISTNSLDTAILCIREFFRYAFHIVHFDRNGISFQVTKHHVNTTRNEMSTHVHPNIRWFWNTAEIKLHVNRTCFHAGLKSETGMSSFHLSCEHTLKIRVLKSFVMFTGKHLCWSLFLIKLQVFFNFGRLLQLFLKNL